MHNNLFAYGTLMVKTIMHEVSGIRQDGLPGRLHGYRRRLVHGEVYPGIRPDQAETVEGMLYRDLDTLAWRRLDGFEGEYYQREPVEVELADGNRLAAQTYVIKPRYASLLTASPWTLEQFLRSGLSPFVTEYRGFRSLQDDA